MTLVKNDKFNLAFFTLPALFCSAGAPCFGAELGNRPHISALQKLCLHKICPTTAG